MSIKIRIIMACALIVLLIGLTCVPTKASILFGEGIKDPGPLNLPVCSCDRYPVECYCYIH